VVVTLHRTEASTLNPPIACQVSISLASAASRSPAAGGHHLHASGPGAPIDGSLNLLKCICHITRVVIVLMEAINSVRSKLWQGRGQVLFDDIRYHFYITTRTDLSAEAVVRCANEGCDQESVIEQLKNGVNALRVPLYDLVSNWAYGDGGAGVERLSPGSLMLHRKSDRTEYITMEFRASSTA
jgi:hypothetical protein